MARYRNALPQLAGDLFLTDGGLETTLVFHDGIDLPAFAAFPLVDDDGGRARLEQYFAEYATLAQRHGLGTVLETPTWRANRDWGPELGYSPERLAEANRRCVEVVASARRAVSDATPVVVSGCIGPRADGYRPGDTMRAEEARDFHRAQLATLADTEVDLASAFTLNYVDEAEGIALAARDVGLPVVLAFTLETDGPLPTGDSLGAAIERVDEATGGGPAYYMVNCAHPTHFEHVLDPSAPWTSRVRGLRVNASTLSHAELDDAELLDDGDPDELGAQVAGLRARLGPIGVLGGCCGTDARHIAAIATACRARRVAG